MNNVPVLLGLLASNPDGLKLLPYLAALAAAWVCVFVAVKWTVYHFAYALILRPYPDAQPKRATQYRLLLGGVADILAVAAAWQARGYPLLILYVALTIARACFWAIPMMRFRGSAEHLAGDRSVILGLGGALLSTVVDALLFAVAWVALSVLL